MSTDEMNGLDWIRENRERVEALAESDRRTANSARVVLDYLDGEREENDGSE